MKKLLTFLFLFYYPIFAQSDSNLLKELFNYSNDLTSITSQLASLSVDAVWLASELAGKEVIYGTLTQNNQGDWAYSNSPSDKLVSIFSDESRLEFVFTKFDGYKSGDADDFKSSHAIEFDAHIPNYINLKVISTATPNSGKTYYNNTISGTIIINGETNTINIDHTFDKYYDIGGSISIGEFNDYVTGTATTSTKSFILAEQYYTVITHNSDAGQFARGRNRWTNSSVTVGNNTYAFKDVRINWYGGTQFADSANAGIYNQVVDDYQWEVMGNVLKNNSTYGNIKFSSPPVSGTYGPVLIASLNSGENIVLDYLLQPVILSAEDINFETTMDFRLSQNYPNPFNPSTVISYSISQEERVVLKIYDTLGREISTLVNSNQEAGKHTVSWNASGLPSGIYFYSIKVGAFSKTKKMILQK